ncbi:MAG: hypothetical protein N3E45_10295 [Oscillatoriaceae bacterium SKW80]|nr:hypothetical protein [Oscillatoriaceae bacterium SKYG93]MCX8121206.1 hypothetical protein [Oscillatoriaceae bacterium SKW80]MDW8453464.1 hypothetical protein [Oscillatoriaceae cyanobacterium SKYGB_i_bin93]
MKELFVDGIKTDISIPSEPPPDNADMMLTPIQQALDLWTNQPLSTRESAVQPKKPTFNDKSLTSNLSIPLLKSLPPKSAGVSTSRAKIMASAAGFTAELNKTWRKWLAACRYCFNQAIIAWQKQNKRVTKRKLRDIIMQSELPDWVKETPCHIRQNAIFDTHQAYTASLAKFRSCRDYQQNIKFIYSEIIGIV